MRERRREQEKEEEGRKERGREGEWERKRSAEAPSALELYSQVVLIRLVCTQVLATQLRSYVRSVHILVC